MRRRVGGWLCVVRADAILTQKAVVVFGAGDTLSSAVHNAGLAIERGAWKADKFG